MRLSRAEYHAIKRRHIVLATALARKTLTEKQRVELRRIRRRLIEHNTVCDDDDAGDER